MNTVSPAAGAKSATSVGSLGSASLVPVYGARKNHCQFRDGAARPVWTRVVIASGAAPSADSFHTTAPAVKSYDGRPATARTRTPDRSSVNGASGVPQSIRSCSPPPSPLDGSSNDVV